MLIVVMHLASYLNEIASLLHATETEETIIFK